MRTWLEQRRNRLVGCLVAPMSLVLLALLSLCWAAPSTIESSFDLLDRFQSHEAETTAATTVAAPRPTPLARRSPSPTATPKPTATPRPSPSPTPSESPTPTPTASDPLGDTIVQMLDQATSLKTAAEHDQAVMEVLAFAISRERHQAAFDAAKKSQDFSKPTSRAQVRGPMRSAEPKVHVGLCRSRRDQDREPPRSGQANDSEHPPHLRAGRLRHPARA